MSLESTSQCLLVVDDDAEIRSLLAEQLAQAGYRVVTAGNGVQMRAALEREAVDLIVLDLNLPGEDGLALCRNLRADSSPQSRTPVVMLTARGEPIDRILGLEMGADDYLPKPFEPRELLARIRSVLRRAEALPANLDAARIKRAMFAGWTLDMEHRHLIAPDGRVVMLSGTDFRLMKVFATHANRVLTREQLAGLAGGRQIDPMDRAIDLQVSRLRQKLGDDPRTSGLIKTVRNGGYVLATPVTLE
ncbi:MAG: response regulator [Lysobacteraceae bacterium]